MDTIEKLLQQDVYRILLGVLLFIFSVVITFIVYRQAIRLLKKKAAITKSKVDDFIIDILKIPVLWLLLWILFKIFSYSFISEVAGFHLVMKINNILLILTAGWLLTKIVRALFYYYLNRLDLTAENNLNARKNFTKLKIFENIFIAIITIVTISFCLMAFESVRSIGISLLTSAGIAGIIVGFAAQKSLATILAGIQIAIAQPIRLDDVVIVEEQWGRIEEITLTYVVVKIWNERRLILPVSYFIEHPFQNWTRNTSNILGSIFLYVDYAFPVEALRAQLQLLLEGEALWDKRVANVQVTDTKERYKELRVLVSSRDASLNWDLQVKLREKLIDFINDKYPDSFVKVRVSGDALSKH